MVTDKKSEVIIIENDPEIADSIASVLINMGYEAIVSNTRSEVMGIIKKSAPGLVIVGNPHDQVSVFDVLKDIVMGSPITSVILVTDISPKEIHEKAEGYGILGHVSRRIDRRELTPLIENFEKIRNSLAKHK